MKKVCYYLLCGCCCSGQQSVFKTERRQKKAKDLKVLNEICLDSKTGTESVWAVTKNPLEVKTTDMTDLYNIPTPGFYSEKDVFAHVGFYLGPEIDSGSYGVILSGQHSIRKLKIAVKKITFPQTTDTKFSAKKEEMIREVKHELFTLQKIIHPHVIKLILHLMIRTQNDLTLYIIMQFAENGNLSKYCERNGPINENKCKVWFAQMLSGLSFMHRQGIAHRDLKLSNMLLDGANDILIADFGLSRLVWRQSIGLIMSHTYCGTPPYMAPEVIRLEEERLREYNAFLADVWSLGVVLYRMFCAEYPFPNTTKKALKYMKKKKYRFPDRCSPSVELKSFIRTIFEFEAKKRPKLEKIKKFAWIKDTFLEVEIKSIEKKRQNEETFKL